MSGLPDQMTSLPAGWVYLIVGLIVFGEDAIVIGFLLPGQTAAILGGVSAGLGNANVAVIIAVVVTAAVLGDSTGYGIGRRYGTRLLAAGPLARRREQVDGIRSTLARRGGPAIFAARFIAFGRAVMPVLAGVSHMRFRTFLAFNGAAAVVWGIAVVLLGYFAGTSYSRIERLVGQAAAITVAVAAVVALIIWRVHRHRRARGR
jgi:membrane protein DedA with SNARE-associated domain